MSHSYKRNPVYKDGSSNRRRIKKYYKKQANKKVRRTRTAFRKTNMYRKISETWNICDYRFYVPLSLEISENEDKLNRWKKWYYRK